MMYGIILCSLISTVYTQELATHFKNCRWNDTKFDNCLKTALNEVRPFFKTGIPQYGVEPFDPFFAKAVTLRRNIATMNFNLLLKNVYESGWTISKITDLNTDFKNNKMSYTQTFPDKFLMGEFELTGNVLGNIFNNSGLWNLTLTDYMQTTTITRKPRKSDNGTLLYDTPIKADIRYQSTRGLKMHLGNSSGQGGLIGNMLNGIINNSWPVGILVVRSFIDELVSSAFSEIFTKAFQNFPFHEVIQ